MMPEPDSYLTLNNVIQLLNEQKSEVIIEESMYVIYHICNSIMNARNYNSKILSDTQEGKDILTFEGYTGTKTRHFYNNICNGSNINYLEIGTWNGSSSISAIYKNKINALFIDNWCQFGGNSDIFIDNIQKYSTDDSVCQLIESDCWKVDLSTIDTKFNVYLFDGDHSELDHFKALEYYLPVLQNEFIFLVDDWNWPNVRDGTFRAIRELNLTVKFRHEEFISSDDLQNMPNHAGKNTWWNGIGIFLLRKN